MENLRKSLYFIGERYYTITIKKDRGAKFMPNYLNFQLSLFGKFSIDPSPDNLTSIMSALNQATDEVFLPNLITGQQVDIPSNRVKSISNLGYVTKDQRFSVALLNERIDINFLKVNDTEESMDDFYCFAKRALSSIAEIKDLKSNRLAMNVQTLIPVENYEDISSIGKNLLNVSEYYADKCVREWSSRMNARTIIRINDNDEQLNVITEAVVMARIPENVPSIILHTDINTAPELVEMRFDKESLDDFIENSLPIAKQVLSEAEGLISRG